MQNCIGELNLTFCLIYLDDIITFSKDEDNQLHCMRVIFDRFWAEHLKLKPSKCNLFQDEITYLAHCVMKDGILLLTSQNQTLTPPFDSLWGW